MLFISLSFKKPKNRIIRGVSYTIEIIMNIKTVKKSNQLKVKALKSLNKYKSSYFLKHVKTFFA